MTDFGDMEPNEMKAATPKKVAYDPRISLNTVVMCLTAIGVSWGMIDKLTTNAAITATLQAETRMNSSSIVQLTQQQTQNRQEVLLELRSLRSEVIRQQLPR